MEAERKKALEEALAERGVALYSGESVMRMSDRRVAICVPFAEAIRLLDAMDDLGWRYESGSAGGGMIFRKVT